MIDKLSFTFGVLCICGSEWLALRHPHWFPLYYYTIMTALLAWRLVAYAQDKYHLFMLGEVYLLTLTATFSPQISVILSTCPSSFRPPSSNRTCSGLRYNL